MFQLSHIRNDSEVKNPYATCRSPAKTIEPGAAPRRRRVAEGIWNGVWNARRGTGPPVGGRRGVTAWTQCCWHGRKVPDYDDVSMFLS